ncbi:MAG: Riboflavin synthase eubacterial/eukaryotic, partial [uncultured Frankineae bacterium]
VHRDRRGARRGRRHRAAAGRLAPDRARAGGHRRRRARRLDRRQRRLPHRRRQHGRHVHRRRHGRDPAPLLAGQPRGRQPGQPRARGPGQRPARRPRRAGTRRRHRRAAAGEPRRALDRGAALAARGPGPLRRREGLHHRRRHLADRQRPGRRLVRGQPDPDDARPHHARPQGSWRRGQPGGRHPGQARREAPAGRRRPRLSRGDVV